MKAVLAQRVSNMLVGITGSSGTGKTTLATDVADALGISFVPSEINKIALAAGFKNASLELSFDERITLQQKILVGYKEFLAELPSNTITDRTPIDIAAYMMAEVTMHSGKKMREFAMQQITTFVEDCLAVTNATFDTVLIVRPLNTYEEIDGKRPPVNPAYQLHTQLIMEGLASRIKRVNKVVTIFTLDRERRAEIATEVLMERMEGIDKMIREDRTYN